MHGATTELVRGFRGFGIEPPGVLDCAGHALDRRVISRDVSASRPSGVFSRGDMNIARHERALVRSVLIGTFLALTAGSGLVASARAQTIPLAQARQLLDSRNADEVRMGIEAMGLNGSPAAVAPLGDRIRRGLPPDLLLAAVDTLTVLGRAEAGPVLFELLSHRRPEVRLRAVQAIAGCRPGGADRALAVALSDSSAHVRAAAARTLGELRANGVAESLFLAFERGVPEAGPALAEIARPEHVRRILEYVGRQPFNALRPMLVRLIQRIDLEQRSRLDVVARLGELATAEARAALEEAAQALSARDPVRRAAEDAAARISS